MADGKQQPTNGSGSRDKKKLKRKEILERNKAIDQLIKAASAENDPLAAFAPFRQYDRNGQRICLESGGSGDTLPLHVKQYIQNLLMLNMEKPFGSEWPTEEKIKRRDMVSPEARYIFVREGQDRDDTSNIEARSPIVGFVHYRFTLEEQVPVVYVYELQLDPRVQGKGLGKFLMQLIELIAHKYHMSAVVLTVQRENTTAMKFYLTKLRYNISSISPSKIGIEKGYEILCKAFDSEAKAKLEN